MRKQEAEKFPKLTHGWEYFILPPAKNETMSINEASERVLRKYHLSNRAELALD